MSYSLKLDEPVAKGVRRVLLSQIEAAERRLGRDDTAPEDIHEARKSFKRIRAVLRLVRSGIGEAAFARENAAFRDIAAKLAGARDRYVLLQTIKLLEVDSGAELGAALAKLTAALGSLEMNGASVDAANGGDGAREALVRARKRISKLRLESDGFDVIRHGIYQTQQQARRAMSAAQASGHDEDFHAWRKRVQQHWRHMKLLAAAWPEYFELRAAAARRLSQVLGDEHDLSVLAGFARDQVGKGLSAKEARVIVAACQERKIALRHEAVTIGARLLADKPRSLARHVEALWEAARRDELSTVSKEPRPNRSKPRGYAGASPKGR
jgi:CHAD domain-containing protein